MADVQRLGIGEFSRITHLSIKTLRRYHESGLLEPATVDPWSNYRYYTGNQVPTAQLIKRFRDLGMPVREVAEVLGTTDPDARTALIGAHLARLERRLDETRAAVASLRRLLDPAPAAELTVERRTTAPTEVAAIRSTVDRNSLLSWYDEAMSELVRVLGQSAVTVTGPTGGLYANEVFTDEKGDVLVYVPVDHPPRSGRVEPFVLPVADLVVTVHVGTHDDIDVTYGALGRYVAEHELAINGPVHETYLVGPRDTPDEHAWRTEIGWPVLAVVTGTDRGPMRTGVSEPG